MKLKKNVTIRFLISLVFIISLGTTLEAQGRGPSTTEERAKVLELNKASELDLMTGVSEQDRTWFIRFLSEVPDISLEIGPVALWCSQSMQKEQQSLGLYHFMLSAVTFKIENPTKAKDAEAVDLAGMEGVLRAYKNLVQKSTNARSATIDEAITLQSKDNLLDFVKQLRSGKK
jgi:carboxypeptidase Q